jgi:hypothetical protein
MIERIAKNIPSPVADAVKETVVEDLYRKYQLRVMNFSLQPFATKNGDFSITIPAFAQRYYDEDYERQMSDALAETLSSETVFYDIGCGFGYHMHLALQSGVPEEQIFSFEPNNFRHAVVERHNNREGITLENKYVGSRQSPGTVTLDEYTSTHPSPDVLKMDIDGAEGTAIEGMREMLEAEMPELFLEIHPVKIERFPRSEQYMYDTLRELGYEMRYADHRRGEVDWKPLTGTPEIRDDDFGVIAKQVD